MSVIFLHIIYNNSFQKHEVYLRYNIVNIVHRYHHHHYPPWGRGHGLRIHAVAPDDLTRRSGVDWCPSPSACSAGGRITNSEGEEVVRAVRGGGVNLVNPLILTILGIKGPCLWRAGCDG